MTGLRGHPREAGTGLGLHACCDLAVGLPAVGTIHAIDVVDCDVARGAVSVNVDHGGSGTYLVNGRPTAAFAIGHAPVARPMQLYKVAHMKIGKREVGAVGALIGHVLSIGPRYRGCQA